MRAVKKSFILGLLSLSCYSWHPLLATTVVTTSDPTGPGSLSDAIDKVNSSTSSSPIEIIQGVTPTLTTTPFPAVTTSLTLASGIDGQVRGINGNLVKKALSFTSGISTITSDIAIADAPIFVTGSTTDLSIEGFLLRSPVDIVSGATVTLSGNNERARQIISVDADSTLILAGRIGSNSLIKASGLVSATATGSSSVRCDQTCSLESLGSLTTFTIPLLTQTKSSTVTITGDGFTSVQHIFVNPYSTMTIDGAISGIHDLNIEGGGVVVLTSENSYLGHTTIGLSEVDSVELNVANSGQMGTTSHDILTRSKAVLKVDGTVFARFLTNGGLTQGTGDITCVELVNNGILHPGNSPGTLNVTGNIGLNSGSTLAISIDPTDASFLNVVGAVDIAKGAIIAVVPDPDCYSKQSQQFTIVQTGGGITGTFSTIDSPALMSTKLTYTPTEIILTVSRAPLDSIALGSNEKAVAKVLENWIDAGNSHLCLELGKLMDLSAGEINTLLDQMQPSLFKGLTVAQENNAVKVRESLGYRNQVELDSMHCHPVHSSKQTKTDACDIHNKPFQIWAAGIGDALHQSNTNYAGSFQIGYQENMGGGVLGFDYHLTDYLYAGALGAYTQSNIKWSDHYGKGSIDTGYAGLYLSAIGDLFYGNAAVIGSWSHYHANRNVIWPDTTYTAKNSHGGAQLLSHIDTGINLGWDGFTIRPFDSFDYITQTEHSYSESGAGYLNLHVNKSNAIMLRNELGLNFAFCFCKRGNKWILSPKISWVREVRIKGANSTTYFEDFQETFSVTGNFPDRSLVSPGLSLTGMLLDERLVIGIYYNGEYRGNYSDHSYGGELRFGF